MTYGERITIYTGQAVTPLRWRYRDVSTRSGNQPNAHELLLVDGSKRSNPVLSTVADLKAAIAALPDPWRGSPHSRPYIGISYSLTTWDGYDVRPALLAGPEDPQDFRPLETKTLTLRGPSRLIPSGTPPIALSWTPAQGPYEGADPIAGYSRFGFGTVAGAAPNEYVFGNIVGGTLVENGEFSDLGGLTARFEGEESVGRPHWCRDAGGEHRWDYERVFSNPIETATLELRWTEGIVAGDFLEWRDELYRIDLVETEGRRRTMTLAASRLAE